MLDDSYTIYLDTRYGAYYLPFGGLCAVIFGILLTIVIDVCVTELFYSVGLGVFFEAVC